MDDCPTCGTACPVRSNTSPEHEANIFICWDCLLAWPPGGSAYPYTDSAMAGRTP